MDREKLQLPKHTASLWSYINRPEILQTILNPMYEPNNRVIWPSVAPVSMVCPNDFIDLLPILFSKDRLLG
jgi:myotubularin-related protein 9